MAPLKAMSERVDERVRDWGVVVQGTLETEGSFIAFGKRGARSVVLKVIRQPGDEWRCGEVLAVEDGVAVDARNPSLRLADAIRPILK